MRQVLLVVSHLIDFCLHYWPEICDGHADAGKSNGNYHILFNVSQSPQSLIPYPVFPLWNKGKLSEVWDFPFLSGYEFSLLTTWWGILVFTLRISDPWIKKQSETFFECFLYSGLYDLGFRIRSLTSGDHTSAVAQLSWLAGRCHLSTILLLSLGCPKVSSGWIPASLFHFFHFIEGRI